MRLDAVEALLDRHLFDRLPVNRQFLALARSDGRLEALPRDEAAQTVVLAGKRVILSPLSRRTLATRLLAWAPAATGSPRRVARGSAGATVAHRRRRRSRRGS